MVTFTNKWGVPDPVFQLLGRERYSRGASRRSATQLIDSPRLVALKERYGDSDEIEVDVADRVWSLFGTAVHKLIEDGLEHSDWHITEERIFSTVNGWVISGAVDLQDYGDRQELVDWKVTTAWAVKKEKIEWVRQLNLLAYLIEKEKGIVIEGLKIGALVRDWSRHEAARDVSYPPAPFVMIPLPLWSFEDRETYVRDRVRLHQEAEMALEMGDEPAPCTPEEMWQSEDQWAVWKVGNKRPTKVCDSEEDAVALAATIKGEAEIEFRSGERKRCAAWCEISKWCIHYNP